MALSKFNAALPESEDFLAQLEDLMREELLGHHIIRSYVYKPISTSGCIRVLFLEPGTPHEQLRGSLKIVPLDTTNFEALSYAWGSWEKPYSITLPDGTIPITRSLYQALLRLRRYTKTRCLWVDAVCIDQTNNEEKSTQIMLMPRIYSEASRTIVYIGEDDENGNVVLDFFEKLGRTNFSSLPSMSITPEWILEHDLPAQGAPLWYTLLEFWRRPWFRRTWVVQEFIMAKDVLIVCGDRSVKWKDLSSAMEKVIEYNLLDWGLFLEIDFQKEKEEAFAGSMCMRLMFDIKKSTRIGPLIANTVRSFSERDESSLRELDEGSWSKFPYVKDLVMTLRSEPGIAQDMTGILEDTIENMLGLMGAPQTGIKLDLVNLFPMFDYTEASVPRDRLFALLGLCKDGEDEGFRPNYDEPIESVLLRYTRTFIKNGQGLAVLYAAGIGPEESQLPSWVPNWTQARRLMSKPLTMTAFTGLVYAAASDIQPTFKFGNLSEELITSGCQLDVITKMIQFPLPGAQNEADSAYILKMNNFFVELDDMVYNGDTYVTGEPPEEVQWRTIIGNMAARPLIAPKEFGDGYFLFRETLSDGTFMPGNNPAAEFFKRVLAINQMYSVCQTKGGLFGLVPRGTKLQDSIYLVAGARMPFVMRPHTVEAGCHQLIGACFVHGMMAGEGTRSENWVPEDVRIR